MSSKIYDINELNEIKQAILLKKKLTPKENMDAINELTKEYMRIQKKIQYYSNDDYRREKSNKTMIYNKLHLETFNEYQRIYQQKKKQRQVVVS